LVGGGNDLTLNYSAASSLTGAVTGIGTWR
jgi:hypothetical protein